MVWRHKITKIFVKKLLLFSSKRPPQPLARMAPAVLLCFNPCYPQDFSRKGGMDHLILILRCHWATERRVLKILYKPMSRTWMEEYPKSRTGGSPTWMLCNWRTKQFKIIHCIQVHAWSHLTSRLNIKLMNARPLVWTSTLGKYVELSRSTFAKYV